MGTDDATEGIVESVDTSLLHADGPISLTVEAFYYDGVGFGEIGKRIVRDRQPADLELLRDALVHRDGAGWVSVPADAPGLPLRGCDYALMIAERLLGGYAGWAYGHSFGPWTAYEYRDEDRRKALDALFGVELPDEKPVYIYRDEDGRDISEEFRRYRVRP